MTDKVDFYMELVEQAWDLSDKAREYVKQSNRDISVNEMIEKIFVPSGMLDLEKTRQQGSEITKIFLNSPYGLQYRPDFKDWIPFRHGPVDI